MKAYEVKYKTMSHLDSVIHEKYVTTFEGEIYEIEPLDPGIYENFKETLVGKVVVKLMLLGLAINDEYPYEYVFDHDAYTKDVGNDIIDFDNEEIKQDILEFYDNCSLNSDICIVERIEIRATHRRQGIGRKVIKDIYNRFVSSCGLFVVQVVPPQSEPRGTEIESEWDIDMRMDMLEPDYEKAFYQLKAFYQRIGFDHIDGYDEYMFLSPFKKNEKMDSIEF